MTEGFVREEVCESRCTSHRIMAERDRARLDKHSESIDKLTAASVQLTELIRHHDKMITENTSRLEQIEQRPASRWENAVGVALGALISAAIAYFLR